MVQALTGCIQTVLVIRFEITINGGLSSASRVGVAKVAIPKSRELVDMKFVDDRMIIMVLFDSGKSDHSAAPS
jgi:hypothetical protein